MGSPLSLSTRFNFCPCFLHFRSIGTNLSTLLMSCSSVASHDFWRKKLQLDVLATFCHWSLLSTRHIAIVQYFFGIWVVYRFHQWQLTIVHQLGRQGPSSADLKVEVADAGLVTSIPPPPPPPPPTKPPSSSSSPPSTSSISPICLLPKKWQLRKLFFKNEPSARLEFKCHNVSSIHAVSPVSLASPVSSVFLGSAVLSVSLSFPYSHSFPPPSLLSLFFGFFSLLCQIDTANIFSIFFVLPWILTLSQLIKH